MILRPRQQEFKKRSLEALEQHGACIGVAPTGAGKTVILSSVAGEYKKPLVLQHRDELVAQNRSTFSKVNPHIRTDLFTSDRKAWSVGATFGMVQTLARDHNLDTMPSDIDLLVVDEAHHSAAETYQKIITRFRDLNPHGHIFGVTATPNRTDRKALVDTFVTVSDIIELSELVQGGFLVKPRCLVIDIGVKEKLSKVPKKASEFDMDAVAAIMDHRPLNDRIVKEWQENCPDRQTVVFCSTVAHAQHLSEAFCSNGVRSVVVHGELPDAERRKILKDYDSGMWQVICNVAVLTEGWDCQPVSCVILAKPCSAKGTMMQMVGRGLRKLDVSRYPGRVKSDCIIMDFGFSLVIHQSFEMNPNLDPEQREGDGSAPEKTCPKCGIKVPAAKRECPICGHVWEVAPEGGETISDFVMTELDMIECSPFRWESLFDNMVLMANGMEAWASVIEFNGLFHSIGGHKSPSGTNVIRKVDVSVDKKSVISSADDFLRQHGDTSLCKKSRSWLSLPPTEKQAELLKGKIGAFGTSRYRASCLITWIFNEGKIKARLLGS
jgi:superfamily II DNA or RNA helicase